MREALFARLGDLEGARVLDLYAGSGALGIEALSRGADRACFVERSARALAVLRANLEQLGLGGRAELRAGDAVRVLRRLGRESLCFDLVLLDPPYAGDEAPRALRALRETGVLAPDATLVLERSRRHPVPRVEGFEIRDERRYGDTVITRLAALGGGGAEPT